MFDDSVGVSQQQCLPEDLDKSFLEVRLSSAPAMRSKNNDLKDRGLLSPMLVATTRMALSDID